MLRIRTYCDCWIAVSVYTPVSIHTFDVYLCVYLQITDVPSPASGLSVSSHSEYPPFICTYIIRHSTKYILGIMQRRGTCWDCYILVTIYPRVWGCTLILYYNTVIDIHSHFVDMMKVGVYWDSYIVPPNWLSLKCSFVVYLCFEMLLKLQSPTRACWRQVLVGAQFASFILMYYR